MRLLHTSDWHLGHQLYGRKRYQEFEHFLSWLTTTIQERDIQALLIAGDIFDNTTPANKSLRLYYEFLASLGNTCCHHVVIIGGNHDSPSLLDGPKDILKNFNIHVIGTARKPIEEVVVLQNPSGQPQAIVCAVPFLRDRDIRLADPGESIEEKMRNLTQGIQQHYQQVYAEADSLRGEADIPIIAMGHLFTTGGKTVEGDGVRELHVGGLGRIGGESFAEGINYLALGHLHMAQQVGGDQSKRYSGSPLAMGFTEARQQKVVLELSCSGKEVTVEDIPVPCWQKLHRIHGDLSSLISELRELCLTDDATWVEVQYDGDEIVSNLREQIHQVVEGSAVSVLRIRNNRIYNHALKQQHTEENLRDLEPQEVFERCMAEAEVALGQRQQLRYNFKEVLRSLDQADCQED